MANKTLGLLIILSIATTVAPATHKINWSPGARTREWKCPWLIKVGDTLEFDYTPGKHNVIEVDKESFENCLVPPNAKVLTSGADQIQLDSAGEKFFICGFGTHCKEGDMKVSIRVNEPALTKMQMDEPDGTKLEAAPSAPTHVEYVVGDDKGWNENVDYEAWMKGKDFYMGDILVFNYTKGKHNVVKVDEAGYNECAVPTNVENEIFESGSDQVTLKYMGNLGIISSIGKDCENGMKLLIPTKCIHTRPKPPALQGGRKLIPSN